MELTAAEPAASTLPSAGPPRPRHQVAVVVLTQGDRPEALERALHSIRRQVGVDVQLVLVQNGGAGPSAVEATVVLPRNQGIPAGRNAGAEFADAEVVAFLDDDAELLGDETLAEVHRRFHDHPNLGALALHVVDDTGQTQQRHVPRIGADSAGRAGQVTYFVGAACAVRTSAFRGAGGFDSRFWYAMEETDLSWRLLDLGWTIWYAADLHAFHPRTAPSRHPGHVLLTARNRVWAAWRSLPLPLFGAYTLTWAVLTVARGDSAHHVLAGYRQAWASRPSRNPMRWRTVRRMTLLGRPPVL